MYILTRYVVWEVLKFFVAALVVLTLFVTLVMGVKEGIRQGAPPVVMLRIMPYMLPEMLGITIPVAMLFSVSSVFGRMTGANEIVAMKSLGISPMVVVWPALVLASFLSLGTVWMYEIAATWCKPNTRRFIAESIEEIAYSMLQKEHRFDGDLFSVIVKRVDKPAKGGDKPRLILPTITIKGRRAARSRSPPPKPTFNTDWQARKLRIKFTDSELDIEGVSLQLPRRDTRIPCEIPVPAARRVPPRLGRDARHSPIGRASFEAGCAMLEKTSRGKRGPRRAGVAARSRRRSTTYPQQRSPVCGPSPIAAGPTGSPVCASR